MYVCIYVWCVVYLMVMWLISRILPISFSLPQEAEVVLESPWTLQTERRRHSQVSWQNNVPCFPSALFLPLHQTLSLPHTSHLKQNRLHKSLSHTRTHTHSLTHTLPHSHIHVHASYVIFSLFIWWSFVGRAPMHSTSLWLWLHRFTISSVCLCAHVRGGGGGGGLVKVVHMYM